MTTFQRPRGRKVIRRGAHHFRRTAFVERPAVALQWQRPEPLYPLLALAINLLVDAVIDLRIVGGEHLVRHGPVLIVANHVSPLESVAVFSACYRLGRRVRFLTASSRFDIPFLRWLLKQGRMIPVHEGGGVERMVKDASSALEAGQAVLVYPEGTIPSPGVILPAQPGAGLLALRTDVPVIPMATWGLEPVRSPSLRRRAVVLVGAPLDISRWVGRQDRRAQLEVSAAMLDRVRALAVQARRAL